MVVSTGFHNQQDDLRRGLTECTIQLSATDVLAPTSMKNAAKCDTSCELQNPVNHQNFERTLRFRDIPGSMPVGVSAQHPSPPLTLLQVRCARAVESGRCTWLLERGECILRRVGPTMKSAVVFPLLERRTASDLLVQGVVRCLTSSNLLYAMRRLTG